MSAAIQYFHERKIVMHDLKPDNVMLMDNKCMFKLVDLEALFMDEDRKKPYLHFRGTFKPPDYLRSKKDWRPTFEYDVWCLGKCLEWLLNIRDGDREVNSYWYQTARREKPWALELKEKIDAEYPQRCPTIQEVLQCPKLVEASTWSRPERHSSPEAADNDAWSPWPEAGATSGANHKADVDD